MKSFIETIISAIKYWVSTYTGDKINKEIVDVRKDIDLNKSTIKEVSSIANTKPDWSQNDETAVDYINNRTHYVELGRKIGASANIYAGRPFQVYHNNLNQLNLQTLKIILNDVSYIVDRDESNTSCLYGDKNFNKYPFYIYESDGIGFIVSNSTGYISTYEAQVKKLPEEFIPDSIKEGISKAQETADKKMDSSDPYGSGRFSLNRSNNGKIGANSIALGYKNIAAYRNLMATGVFNIQDNPPKYGLYVDVDIGYSTRTTSNVWATDEYSFNENTGEFTLLNPVKMEMAEAFATFGSGVLFQENGAYDEPLPDVYTTYGQRSSTSYSTYLVKVVEGSQANGKYLHVVGNGKSNLSRSNAHTLDWEGNAWFSGDVFVGGKGQDDATARLLKTSEIATDEGVMDLLAELDIVTPVTTSDGELFVSNTGEIYSL